MSSNSNKPIHPHELLEHNTRLKKHILNNVFRIVLAMFITPSVLYMVYNPPTLLNRILFGIETAELTEFKQQKQVLVQKLDRQKQQIENQNKLIGQLQKRNNIVSSVPNAEQLHLPVVSSSFIPWSNYLKQHPKAKFSDYRTAQVKYLEQQLQLSIQFFNQLKQSR